MYLPSIISREKWLTNAEPLEVGDIVLTVDTGVTDSWRLGRITKVDTGSNNQTRKVEIALGKKNVFDKLRIKDRKKLLETYLQEKITIVTRPAVAVAKIKC